MDLKKTQAKQHLSPITYSVFLYQEQLALRRANQKDLVRAKQNLTSEVIIDIMRCNYLRNKEDLDSLSWLINYKNHLQQLQQQEAERKYQNINTCLLLSAMNEANPGLQRAANVQQTRLTKKRKCTSSSSAPKRTKYHKNNVSTCSSTCLLENIAGHQRKLLHRFKELFGDDSDDENLLMEKRDTGTKNIATLKRKRTKRDSMHEAKLLRKRQRHFA